LGDTLSPSPICDGHGSVDEKHHERLRHSQQGLLSGRYLDSHSSDVSCTQSKVTQALI